MLYQQCLSTFDKRFPIQAADDIPFRRELSLAPLLEFWQHAVPTSLPAQQALVSSMAAELAQAPALRKPLTDLAVLTEHQALVDTLMTVAFPLASWDETYAAALVPFELRAFYTTPSFKRLFLTPEGEMAGRLNVDAHTATRVKLLYAYLCILRTHYGIEFDFDYPLIFTASDPDTGLDRHFRLNFDPRFLQIKTVGDPPRLTEQEKQHLLAHIADPTVLMELLPPEQFMLHGFITLNAIEVTDQEVLSSLKRDLIEKESIISATRFRGLQQKLRTLFNKPDLCFGLAALQDDRVFMLKSESHFEYG
jgi:hypothetical protein